MKTTGKVTKKVSLGRGAKGKRLMTDRKPPRPVPAPRVPRITKLMALAIKFDQMIRDGVVKDQAELARMGFVTRARVTQIMNLLNLSPTIQDALLQVAPQKYGKDAFTERQLRTVLDDVTWSAQGRTWTSLNSKTVDPVANQIHNSPITVVRPSAVRRSQPR
ncbi:MAG TPA: hypothetical protein VM510_12155 [Caulifigura sp.]|nr:hypothetical protein [Caulifigura sp.]